MRLLIVGGGSIGERHIRCFTKADPICQVSVIDPDDARRQFLRREFSDIYTYACLLGQVPHRVFDAAVICSPPHLHMHHALQLVDAGIHVLIEKPLCVKESEEAEVKALVKLARQRKVLVGVAHTYRSYPLLQKMAAEVKAGDIGKPFMAHVTMAYDWRKERPDYRTNYFGKAETGGGAILCVVSHAAGVLTWMLGPVKSVQCLSGRLGPEKLAVEDTALVQLEFKSGAVAQIRACVCQPRRHTQVYVIGSAGVRRYQTFFSLGRERFELKGTAGDGLPVSCDKEPLDMDAPFVVQAKNFLDAIQGKAELPCSLMEGLHIQRVCWAAKRAAKTGRKVEVKP